MNKIFVGILLLLTFAVVVSCQRAYPNNRSVKLVGEPSLATNFAIDLPINAIQSVQSESEEDFEMSDAESDSSIASGASLKATTALNVRSGPCTGKSIITTLGNGQVVKFTGEVQSGCGYTWYKVSGSFGTGYAASNFLTVVQNGGGGGSTSGCRQNYNYPLFKQCDSRWGGDRLGSSSTICQVGCLMNSVCSALNGRGKSSMNPGQLNQYLLKNGGYYGNLFVWGAVSRLGFNYLGQTTDKQAIINWVCQGKVVILNVRNGGHWVLAKSYSNGVFEVNDSGFSVSSYTSAQVVRAAGFNA